MARRAVVKTRYSEAYSGGKTREAVECQLTCGHKVTVLYNPRRAYTHANCPWCNREKAEGVKYVWYYSPHGSAYAPKKEDT